MPHQTSTITQVAPALAAMLDSFIDYAGIYPPAALALDSAMANFKDYRRGRFSWMLRWLVVGSGELERVPADLDGAVSLLASSDNARAATIESKAPIAAAQHAVYCEVASSNLDQLDEVRRTGCFAKIRMGGVVPDAIPSSADVSAFIMECAKRKLAFKATAGLHHPIRANYSLTYEPDAPKAVMHGFLNLLMAAGLAWSGETDIQPILEETDPKAFSFNDAAHWRDKRLTVDQIKDMRANFLHSIGSCSFDEPVRELQALGLLPQ